MAERFLLDGLPLSKLAKEKDRNLVVFPTDTFTSSAYKLFKAPNEVYFNIQQEKQHDEFLAPNLSFYLKFYFPKLWLLGQADKRNNLVIMLNGLNEIHDRHLRMYDQLGRTLAYNGIASVLFPAPCHLNRAPRLNGKTIIPSRTLEKHPKALLMNFQQVILELDRLLSYVRAGKECEDEDDRHFYSYFFSEKTSVSLLGYSLGGLMALVSFMHRPRDYNRCFLVNSGCKLHRLRPDIMLEQSKWERISGEVRKVKENVRRRRGCIPEDIELINAVFFEENIAGGPYDLKRHSNKLMIILGGRDKIVRPEDVRRLEPAGYGLNIVQISGLGHFPMRDLEWSSWYPNIVELINDFVKMPAVMLPRRDDVLKAIYRYHRKLNQKLLEGLNTLGYQELWKRVKNILVRNEKERSKLVKSFMSLNLYFSDDESLRAGLIRYGKENGLLIGEILTSEFGIQRKLINQAVQEEKATGTRGKMISKSKKENSSLKVKDALEAQEKRFKDRGL